MIVFRVTDSHFVTRYYAGVGIIYIYIFRSIAFSGVPRNFLSEGPNLKFVLRKQNLDIFQSVFFDEM